MFLSWLLKWTLFVLFFFCSVPLTSASSHNLPPDVPGFAPAFLVPLFTCLTPAAPFAQFSLHFYHLTLLHQSLTLSGHFASLPTSIKPGHFLISCLMCKHKYIFTMFQQFLAIYMFCLDCLLNLIPSPVLTSLPVVGLFVVSGFASYQSCLSCLPGKQVSLFRNHFKIDMSTYWLFLWFGWRRMDLPICHKGETEFQLLHSHIMSNNSWEYFRQGEWRFHPIVCCRRFLQLLFWLWVTACILSSHRWLQKKSACLKL